MTVTYLPRDEWDNSGAARSGHVVPASQFVGLVVHHTVTIHAPRPGIGDEVAHMRLLRTIRPDLGEDVPYTAVVFRGENPDDAVLAEGRGPGRTGAHTSGYNSTRYGIAYAGNSGTDGMTRGVLDAYRLAGRMWLPHATARTVGHGQLPDQGTACPGGWLLDHLAELQPPFAEVSFAPATPPPPPPRRSTPMDLEIRRDVEGSVIVGPPDFGHKTAVVYYDATLVPAGAKVAVAPRRPDVPNFQASAVVTPLKEDKKLDPPAGVRPIDWSGWGRPAVFPVASDSYVTIVVDARCTPDQVRAVLV